jgi:hypothetical protein
MDFYTPDTSRGKKEISTLCASRAILLLPPTDRFSLPRRARADSRLDFREAEENLHFAVIWISFPLFLYFLFR